MMEPSEGGDSILLRLPEHIFRTIVQHLRVTEKKNLRLSSASIKRRLQDNDNTFNNWTFDYITPEQMFQVAEEAEQIIELTVGTHFTLYSKETKDTFIRDEAVRYVIEKHPELQAIMIYNHFAISDKGLEKVLSAENIKTVLISSDKITGTGINPEGNYSKKIQSLTLKSSGLSDQGLVQILQHCGAGLKSLAILLSDISGEGHGVLRGKLINMEKLDLTSLHLTKKGLIEMLQMCGTKLNALDLSNTSLTGEGLSVLQGHFLYLDTLSLINCKDITKEGMLEILQMCGTKLKFLNLSGTKISDEYLAGFKGKLLNLETLTLVNCKDITQQGILGLLQLCGTQLKVLDLSKTKVTGEGMSVLKDKFMNLETLELKFCDSITDQGVVEFLQMCGTKLKVLDLSQANISGEGLSALNVKFINLETLALAGCKGITPQGLVELLQVCGTQLKALNLCFTNVTGEGLSVLQGNFVKLGTLNLSRWEGFTEQGLIDIVQICGTELKSLDLSRTRITCEGLSALEGKLVNLETLNLGYCSGITELGMMELLQICGTRLRSLILGSIWEGIPPSILAIAEAAKFTNPKLKISTVH